MNRQDDTGTDTHDVKVTDGIIEEQTIYDDRGTDTLRQMNRQDHRGTDKMMSEEQIRG